MRMKKWDFRILAAVMACFLLISASGCKSVPDTVRGKEQKSAEIEDTTTQEADKDSADLLYRYYYSRYTEEEKKIYRELLYGIQNGLEEIRVEYAMPEQVNDIYQCLLMDYPEFFWCNGAVKTTAYYETEPYAAVYPEYTYSGEQKDQMSDEIEAGVQECLNGLSGTETEYQKIRYVYEYIIDMVDYVKDAPDNQNIYSVFAGKQSVCAGYAKATQYLLNRMGIFCTYVVGTVISQESHAWNIVECEGKYYHVDTTWGEPVFSEEAPESVASEITYDYLCCPDKEIFKTHIPSDEYEIPVCSSEDFEYYRLNGLYYDAVDEARMAQEMDTAIERRDPVVVFKFADDSSYQQAKGILNSYLLEKKAKYLGELYGLQEVYYMFRESEELDKIVIIWQYE